MWRGAHLVEGGSMGHQLLMAEVLRMPFCHPCSWNPGPVWAARTPHKAASLLVPRMAFFFPMWKPGLPVGRVHRSLAWSFLAQPLITAEHSL